MEKWIETGKIEPADLGRIYELLSAPLPQVAAQHADAKTTKKGYDTTGYRPQFFVNRMNEVCGLGGWRITITEKTLEKITFGSGEGWEAIIAVQAEIGNWIIGDEYFLTLAERTHFGGQRSRTPDDALKGALMAATSKVLSGFGVGKLAYEGGLDEALKSGEEAPPAAPPPEATGQRPETEKHETQGPNPGQTIDQLTELEKKHHQVERLDDALKKFVEAGKDTEFWAILEKFKAKAIARIQVSAIENVRKALLEKYTEITSKPSNS